LIIAIEINLGQEVPEIRNEDKLRISEAKNISNFTGDKIWKGISKVPFTMLLISDSTEYLINFPGSPEEFGLSYFDDELNSKVYYRRRELNKGFFATFPAFSGINCIVAGTPENTGKNSTDWIITILHECFHLYQFTSENYYESVNALNLSKGDNTGMWQLNYAFPYEDSLLNIQYENYVIALTDAVYNIDKNDFDEYFDRYISERLRFKELLSPDDYSYMSLQLWQEGIAEYTEYKFLESMGAYSTSKNVAELSDFIPFDLYKTKHFEDNMKTLSELRLSEGKRVCFYAPGFAEGILLDKVYPEWRDEYLLNKFSVDDYLFGK